jgi:hypothetical protein
MNKNTAIIGIIISLIVGIGVVYVIGNTDMTGVNTPNSAENAPEGSIHNLPVPAGVSAARKQLAADLNIQENMILIETAFERQWSDSCLGLGGPAESCLQAITPGYEVTMQAGGTTYVYRTTMDGTAVRKEK